jgi:hypothetical protein
VNSTLYPECRSRRVRPARLKGFARWARSRTPLASVLFTRRRSHASKRASFIFNHFQIPPLQPSISIPFIFIQIQIPSSASPAFSKRSALPGVSHHPLSPSALSYRLSAFFSAAGRLLVLSLQRFLPLVLFVFSSLQTLFCRPGGWAAHVVPSPARKSASPESRNLTR